jgi:pimeloyl-ACP methyl ester carboxylesterase
MITHRIIRWLSILFLLGAIPLLMLAGCQSKLIYFPRPYGPETTQMWQSRFRGEIIRYESPHGRQQAYLQGKLDAPRNLWVVCGGNGSLALEWADWLRDHASPEDAFLLIDYPGYGANEGSPSPAKIRENLKIAIPSAWSRIGGKGAPDPSILRILGHSLGCAATLIAAVDFKISRGVLISPFTSTMDMSQAVTGLPFGFVVWHRFDNVARLDDLAKQGPGEIIILHGVKDEVIPVEMGRRLAKRHPEMVRLIEVPDAYHNNIQQDHADLLARALDEVAK